MALRSWELGLYIFSLINVFNMIIIIILSLPFLLSLLFFLFILPVLLYYRDLWLSFRMSLNKHRNHHVCHVDFTWLTLGVTHFVQENYKSCFNPHSLFKLILISCSSLFSYLFIFTFNSFLFPATTHSPYISTSTTTTITIITTTTTITITTTTTITTLHWT